MLACKAVAVFYRINNNVARDSRCYLQEVLSTIISTDYYDRLVTIRLYISWPRCFVPISSAITSTVFNGRLIAADTFSGNAFKDLFAALDRASRHFRQGRPFQFPQYTS